MTADEKIGHNIRSARRLRRLTGDELAERCEMTGGVIRKIERGQRELKVDELIRICVALNCSVQTILDGTDPRFPDKETRKEIGVLSAEEHDILRYIATDWDGDKKALIIADGVYAAISPARRHSIIMELVEQMTKALECGELSVSDLPQGLPYLEQRIGAMTQEEL